MGRSEGMSFITAIVIVSLLAGSVPGQKEIPTACYQDARQISRGPRELVQLSTPLSAPSNGLNFQRPRITETSHDSETPLFQI